MKVLSQFPRKTGSPDGHQSWCTSCHNEANHGIRAVTRLARKMAGRPLDKLDRSTRLRFRSLARELLDRDEHFEREAAAIGAERRGFVYIITNRAYPGFVKVGKAVNVESRVSGLNTGDPFRCFRAEYAQFFEDALRIEREFHEAHADVRMEGEWFAMDVSTARAALYREWEKH